LDLRYTCCGTKLWPGCGCALQAYSFQVADLQGPAVMRQLTHPAVAGISIARLF